MQCLGVLAVLAGVALGDLQRPTPVLDRRGGAAGGDGSYYTDTTQTYATVPPKSTYSGPTINGSAGGFFGLLFGLLAFVTIIGGGIWLLLRRRRNIKRRRARLAPMKAAYGGRRRGQPDDDDEMELGNEGRPGLGRRDDAWKSSVSVNDFAGGDANFPPDYANYAQSAESVGFEPARDVPEPTSGPEYSSVNRHDTV